ncbi:MAG TPA: hypothetical protein VMK82_01745 [Steroidobacteraceae bacterium]|nr:hypothetical protein [Steroidobacteraceae bacterium]
MNSPSRSILAAGFETCVGIVRFRKGPEDLPASTSLLAAALAGAVLLRIALLSIPTAETRINPVVVMLLDFGITLLCVFVALRAAGHSARFLQTITAIFGAQVVLAPALFASRWMLLTYYEQPGIGGMARLFYVVVSVWMLAVLVRILRSATGWPLFACVLLALTIEVLVLVAALTLFPLEQDLTTPA